MYVVELVDNLADIAQDAFNNLGQSSFGDRLVDISVGTVRVITPSKAPSDEAIFLDSEFAL